MFPRAIGVDPDGRHRCLPGRRGPAVLATDVADFVSPVVLVPLVIVAEVSMLGYLLVKGVRTTAPASTPTHVERELVSH